MSNEFPADVRMFPDGRMTAPSAAAYLGLSYKVLANQRCQGLGPPFFKTGKFIFYKRDDLDRWMDSCRVNSTAEYRAKRKAA